MISQSSLEYRFKQILKDFESESFVLAVSGGVDSMVMLDLFGLFSSAPKVVAYFDHGIRPDTQVEIQLIQAKCNELGLKFILGGAKVLEMEGNLEANARKKRYEFLESCRPKGGFVVTAHHADDQIETVFMNFLKGSFVSGLAGLARIDSARNLWRPLLDFKKSELIEYANANKIEFIEDYTNESLDFMRNYCRKDIIPTLNAKFGSLGPLARNADFYGELDAYLDSQVEDYLKINLLNNSIVRSSLVNLPSFLRFKVYQTLNPDYDLSVADFKELDDLVIKGVTGKFRLMGKVEFRIRGLKLEIKPNF